MRFIKWHQLLIGAAGTIIVLVPAVVFLFVTSGVYDVGASVRHTKFTEWITHETMIHSVRRHAKGISPPKWSSAAQLFAGFCAYETHCEACHGAAGVARQSWVGGLEPSPPYLLDVTKRFTPSELFWIAKNGIKMTGMPGWGDSMSDRQIWNVVGWIEISEKLPPQTYMRWRAERHCPRSNPTAVPPAVPPEPATP